MAREYRYLVLDVFTTEGLAGNALAVFLDGAGLSTDEMQALARETNLSETTFCLPGQASTAEAVRVRIFTTVEELPFAGHPTLGTAAALRLTLPQLRVTDTISLELAVGTVVVHYPAPPSPSPGFLTSESEKQASTADLAAKANQPLYGEMEQPLPVFSRQHPPAAVAAALSLPLAALHPRLAPQTVSTGLPFVVVPLASTEWLRQLAISQKSAEAYLAGTDGKFFYVIAPGGSATEWRARMQFTGGEDPATGSAAGCAAAYLVRHGVIAHGTAFTLRQGLEIQRPSTIGCRAALLPTTPTSTSGTPTGQKWDAGSYVRVGGSTVLVAEGRFFLP